MGKRAIHTKNRLLCKKKDRTNFRNLSGPEEAPRPFREYSKQGKGDGNAFPLKVRL
jgi:hypothetical protein